MRAWPGGGGCTRALKPSSSPGRRRHSFGGGGGGGGGGDSSEQSDEPAGHPLLTILTNIRNGGPEDSCDADEPLAVEAGRGSFVRNRSSSTRVGVQRRPLFCRIKLRQPCERLCCLNHDRTRQL